MSVIKWATGVNGTFSLGADWVGGVAPGINDVAEINAPAKSPYTILLNSSIGLAGLVLDNAAARLDISNATLASNDIEMQSGVLELDQGTLKGTITDTGGRLTIRHGGGNSTLNNVTWRGTLDPLFLGGGVSHPTMLTINGGITLTGANGSGPGNAVFHGSVDLNGVHTLNNASISAGDLLVTHCSTLTLGAALSLTSFYQGYTAPTIKLDNGVTLINNGTLSNYAIEYGVSGTGTFINNGEIIVTAANYGISINASSLTNNGTINVESGAYLSVNANAFQAPAAKSSIVVDGGTLALTGSLTTAALQALYAAQHITTNNAGFAVANLNNAGAVLNIGTGTTLGTLTNIATSITGGTVVDHGGDGNIYENLTNVTYNSASTTVNIGPYNFNQVFANSTLTNISTITMSNGTLTLENVAFTGPAGNTSEQFSLQNCSVTLAGSQTLIGDTVTLSGANLLFESALGTDSATINNTTFNITGGAQSTIAEGGNTFGTGVAVNVAAASSVIFGPYFNNPPSMTFEGTAQSAGAFNVHLSSGATFTNTGDITVTSGGTFALQSGNLVNSGTIHVTGGVLQLNLDGATNTVINSGALAVTNGTLALTGIVDQSALTEFNAPGSQILVDGALVLASQSATLGSANLPDFSLGYSTTSNIASSITGGTLQINAGTTLAIATGPNFTTNLNIGLVNNGVISIDAGTGQTPTGLASVAGSISGDGTIELGRVRGLILKNGAVSAGETIAFQGASQSLEFATGNSIPAFAGTLSGFSAGDIISFGTAGLTGGSFVGDSIVATFSNGNSLVLATTSALTGSLTVSGDQLIYSASDPAGHGWSDPAGQTAGSELATLAALPQDSHSPLDWFLPLHAL